LDLVWERRHRLVALPRHQVAPPGARGQRWPATQLHTLRILSAAGGGGRRWVCSAGPGPVQADRPGLPHDSRHFACRTAPHGQTAPWPGMCAIQKRQLPVRRRGSNDNDGTVKPTGMRDKGLAMSSSLEGAPQRPGLDALHCAAGKVRLARRQQRPAQCHRFWRRCRRCDAYTGA
jgi:hypothetical protein